MIPRSAAPTSWLRCHTIDPQSVRPCAYNGCIPNKPNMRYEVLVPSAPYESESVCDLDRAYLICLDLAEEFGYAEIRHNGHHIADYGNPATFPGVTV
jgi:hypothetical protein